jgi:hypothetical protein
MGFSARIQGARYSGNRLIEKVVDIDVQNRVIYPLMDEEVHNA